MEIFAGAVARGLLDPKPGYRRVRLVRRGPWVAAEIRKDGQELIAEVCGRGVVWRGTLDVLAAEADEARSQGRAFSHPFLRISLFGILIEKPEWQYLTDRRLWAIAHAPDDPYASAGEPIDLNALPPLF